MSATETGTYIGEAQVIASTQVSEQQTWSWCHWDCVITSIFCIYPSIISTCHVFLSRGAALSPSTAFQITFQVRQLVTAQFQLMKSMCRKPVAVVFVPDTTFGGAQIQSYWALIVAEHEVTLAWEEGSCLVESCVHDGWFSLCWNGSDKSKWLSFVWFFVIDMCYPLAKLWQSCSNSHRGVICGSDRSKHPESAFRRIIRNSYHFLSAWGTVAQ